MNGEFKKDSLQSRKSAVSEIYAQILLHDLFLKFEIKQGSFCQFALIYSTCILLILILTERLSFFDAFRGIIFFPSIILRQFLLD